MYLFCSGFCATSVITLTAYGSDKIMMGIPASGPTLSECPCDADLEEIECRCTGPGLMDIPSNLPLRLLIL